MMGAKKTILRRILPKKWYLQIAFKIKFGKWINFSSPVSLNEKLQYSKIYGYRDFHKIIADKYEVRKFVKANAGDKYLIPLVGVIHNCKDLDFSNLPSSFIAKSAHGSGQVIIVKDKSKISENHLRETFKKWLKTNFYLVSMEPQYRYIKPKIVIEKLITDDEGQIPKDYKLHCFAGKVEMIQVDIDRFGEHRRNFYNCNWELLPFVWSPVDRNKKIIYANGPLIERPKQLDEMINLAEKMAKNFNYIRVDLFNVKGKVHFGELTSNGHMICPHTHNHVFLRDIRDEATVWLELIQPRKILEDLLHSRVRALAFPVGTEKQVGALAYDCIRQHYDFCFTALPGVNSRKTAPHRLHRDCLAAEAPLSYVRMVMTGTYDLYYKIRMHRLTKRIN